MKSLQQMGQQIGPLSSIDCTPLRVVLKAEDKQLLIHLPSPVANPSEEEARSPSPPCRNGGGGGGATEPMAADYLVSEETCFSKKSALVFIRPRNNATSL